MILALDASTETGTMAVVASGRLVREFLFAGGRAKGGGVTRALEEMGDLEQVGGVVVGIGPGSYSGVRAAVAAAWGFAVARRLPLVGVSSLLALAPGEYLAAGDARRGEFYYAHIRDGEFVEAPGLFSSEELARRCEEKPDLPVLVPQEIPEIVPRALVATPRASLLAGLARFDHMAKDPPPMPLPLYLKAPHATFPKGHA